MKWIIITATFLLGYLIMHILMGTIYYFIQNDNITGVIITYSQALLNEGHFTIGWMLYSIVGWAFAASAFEYISNLKMKDKII